jgi:hypothetical protein
MPAENKPAGSFRREDRYIVIKRNDMEKASADIRRSFSGQCRKLHDSMLISGAPARMFLVIESDWPEYEPAWQMIERRMTGQPPVTAAEELEAVRYWRGKHTQAIRERDALQLLLNDRDEQNHSLEQRRQAEQQSGMAAERRVQELQATLKDLISAVRSINRSPAYKVTIIGDDEPQYRQRKEWIDWVLELCDKASAGLEQPATAFGFPVVVDPTLAPNEMRLVQPAPVAVELADRSPENYAIEHAEYMAKSADDVLARFQAYGLALLAVDEGGDDGEDELFEAIDSARGDLQESLVDLRGMIYEFRKRSNRCKSL